MMSSCWQVTFRPAAPDNETLENFLEQYFEVTACNYDDDGNDEYVGYQSGTFDEKAMVEAAHAAAINLPPYEVTFLESSNWLKDYVIKFAPFETEDFMFYGIHETSCPQTSLIPVQIYAATAFGSDHQTTRSCIKALSRLYHQGFSADNILDVGTGSGILSLAAAKLWGEKCAITAVDIDEEAVWVTRQNAQNNSVDHLITAEVSDGFHAGIVKQNAPYQLILANILARPLLDMAPDLAASLASGGYAVLSGFVEDQADWIISAYQQNGLKLIELYALDNWRAALMMKD